MGRFAVRVICLIVSCLVVVARPIAAETQAIAAVVNDDVISVRDVNNRISLFVASARIEPKPEELKRLSTEALRALIDDRLKKQEARRNNIVVTREDIEQALNNVARQLQIQPNELGKFLSEHGTSLSVLVEQIETEIGWLRTVNRLAVDQLRVSDDEVEQELVRRRELAGSPEFRIAEIFLPVDDPQDDVRVHTFAENLVDQLRHGASFPALARNFSEGPSAALGGDLGWVRLGQMAPQIDRVLGSLQPGQLAGPLRSGSGYHIIVMIDRRIITAPGGNVVMDLHQVVLPLAPTASAAELSETIDRARELSAGVSNCDEFDARGRAIGSPLTGSLGSVDIRQMPPEFRRALLPLHGGQVASPMRADNAVVVIMVCDRRDEGMDPNTREQIRQSIRDERAAAASRRLLRDLRRTALIDIRQ